MYQNISKIVTILLMVITCYLWSAPLPVDAKYLSELCQLIISPNFESREDKYTHKLIKRPTMLILNYTVWGLKETEHEFEMPKSLSSHYLVSRMGKLIQFVPDNMRAYDAGVSQWYNIHDVNSNSIGIEIVNDGYKTSASQPEGISVKGSVHFWYPFPKKQIKSLIKLIKDIYTRFPIAPHLVLGQSDIAVGRKVDPGPLFPWQDLAKEGIGAWPDLTIPLKKVVLPKHVDEAWFYKHLKLYGYKISPECPDDEKAYRKELVKAFQMHFRQNNIDGIIDYECMKILAALVDQYIL